METSMPNPEVSFPARYTPVNAVAFAKADGSSEVVSASTPLPVASTALPASSNHIGNVFVDDVADGLAISGTATSVTTLISAPLAGYGGGTFHVTAGGNGCTVNYEQSNDGINWVPLPVILASAAASSVTTTSTGGGMYAFSSSSGHVRARVSVYGSGTVSAVLVLKRRPLSVSSTSLAGGSASIGSVLPQVRRTMASALPIASPHWEQLPRLPELAVPVISASIRFLQPRPLPMSQALCSSTNRLIVGAHITLSRRLRCSPESVSNFLPA
jgi:hypothetical protein